jgi:3-methyladenine DNA glycosylase AlkC
MAAQSTPPSEPGDRFSLKDYLFNEETVTFLAGLFEDAGVFRADPFVDQVMARLAPLELKERSAMIAEVLADHLPQEFPKAAQAIQAALPPPLDPGKTDDDFGRFIFAPLGDYVAAHGLEHHRDLSLDLMEELTQQFSMEFTLRPFLNRWPDETLARLRDWAGHPHYHVRRLVSEGTRPRLPWGQKVGLTQAETLPLLDQLYGDPTRFVTRSVANHLNDIAKADAQAVLKRLDRWRSAGGQDPKELDWMARHALRGLIKAGHPGAMAALGYRPDARVRLSDLGVAPSPVERGGVLEIELTLTATRHEPVIVDYIITFARPGGKSADKVFKLKTLTLASGDPKRLSKRHPLKADASTFTLHPGPHRLAVQVNGQVLGTADFDLV